MSNPSPFSEYLINFRSLVRVGETNGGKGTAIWVDRASSASHLTTHLCAAQSMKLYL